MDRAASGERPSDLAPKTFRSWVKARQHPLASAIYYVGTAFRRAHVPHIMFIHRPLYFADRWVKQFWRNLTSIVWFTPLFQSRLVRPAPSLRVWGGVPLVMGDLTIEIGENCCFFGSHTMVGRSAGGAVPHLKIGNNVEVGYQSQFAVGRRVEIGNNVLIATGCSIAGYPGHPLDPVARARHEAELESQVGDIIIEDDVWLAAGVRVMTGVRIGRGTIVGAGSVVTRDLPPGVVAAGVPARPIKTLAEAGVKGFEP